MYFVIYIRFFIVFFLQDFPCLKILHVNRSKNRSKKNIDSWAYNNTFFQFLSGFLRIDTWLILYSSSIRCSLRSTCSLVVFSWQEGTTRAKRYYCTRILADHSILDRSLDWAFTDLRYIAAETCKSRLADEPFYSVFIDRSSERSPPCWRGSMAFVAFLAVDPGFTFVPLLPLSGGSSRYLCQVALILQGELQKGSIYLEKIAGSSKKRITYIKYITSLLYKYILIMAL